MFLTNCLVVIVKYWYFQNRTNFSETLRIPENSKVYVFLKTRGSADGSADPQKVDFNLIDNPAPNLPAEASQKKTPAKTLLEYQLDGIFSQTRTT